MAVDRTLRERAHGLTNAAADHFTQEFDWSVGHLTALLGSCVFAPSLLTFWLVNGILDFSTALLIGAVASPGGLVVRFVAYLLLVPTFLGLQMGYYLGHPRHRKAVFSGACPNSELLSLDWFSVGILATGLPLALQTLGPWIGANTIFLLGIFALPRFVASEHRRLAVRAIALVAGTLLFLYATYGVALVEWVPFVPAPSATLGWIATLTLSDNTVEWLLAVTNSLLVGPLVVAAVALVSNLVLTRPELRSMPLVRHSLPARDPGRQVFTSAALGTLFYLSVVAVWTGEVILVP